MTGEDATAAAISARRGIFRRPWRFSIIPALLLLTVAFAACEQPDTSFQTSPSVRAFLGTTTGSVVLNSLETPPAPKDPPKKWAFELALANFAALDNGTPALRIVLQVTAQPGAGMELWLTRDADNHTIARWSGGSTSIYEGAVCFQLTTADKTEALPLTPGKYSVTVDFLDPSTGLVVSRKSQVTSFTPHSTLPPPGPNSTLFSVAYACPRGN